WPGAALTRPDDVDSAALAVAVVEDAIAVFLLAQGAAARRLARIQRPHFFERFASVRGDSGQLLVVNPDEARLARAAGAAAGAAETEAVLIPGLVHRSCLE